MSDYEYLEVEKEDAIAFVFLNRPEKKNALSAAVRRELEHCFGRIAADEGLKVVVLGGRGAAFSAGFDLNELAAADPARREAAYETSAGYQRQLMNLPLPTIAAIGGPALAGGFDLALACDIRIAAENALFGHPEIKFGMPVLYSILAAVVGAGVARELAFTGRRFNAQEALRLGIVNRVVPAAELLPAARAMAQSIAEAPRSGLVAVKRLALDTSGMDLNAAFALEDRAFHELGEHGAIQIKRYPNQ